MKVMIMDEIESVLNRVPAITDSVKLHLLKLGKDFKKLPENIQEDVLTAAVSIRNIGLQTRSLTEAEKETIWHVLKNAAKTMY
jgi:hypothetical protein